MPRCPAHCPPPTSSPALPAAIIAGVLAIAATWTVIVHILTILVITLGVVAGLGVAGLAAIILTRLRDTARPATAARSGPPRSSLASSPSPPPGP